MFFIASLIFISNAISEQIWVGEITGRVSGKITLNVTQAQNEAGIMIVKSKVKLKLKG